MRRGELWWASLREPEGSEPGYSRPVVILQANVFNESPIDTVIVATVTSNLRLGEAPGNVRLPKKRSNLSRDSVINLSQILTVNKTRLRERIGRLGSRELNAINEGLRLILAVPN